LRPELTGRFRIRNQGLIGRSDCLGFGGSAFPDWPPLTLNYGWGISGKPHSDGGSLPADFASRPASLQILQMTSLSAARFHGAIDAI
jgi:hypothetical protein